MLVTAIVVQDHVDKLAGRNGSLDGIGSADELAMAMPLHAAAEYGAVQDVESREQGRGAVSGIVVGLTGWVP